MFRCLNELCYVILDVLAAPWGENNIFGFFWGLTCKLRANKIWYQQRCLTNQSFKSIHTCGKDHKNSKISSRWLANKYLPFFTDDHTWTTNVLKGAVFRDHEADVTLDQCYKAKRMAFEMIHAAKEKQYERL